MESVGKLGEANAERWDFIWLGRRSTKGRELGMLIPGLLPTKQQASGPSQFPRRHSRNKNQFDYHQIKLGWIDWGKEENNDSDDSYEHLLCAAYAPGFMCFMCQPG